ncbi:DUF4176 domain-containing protein [Bombilactobacillus folatiphilus]|uniref:DUF4176 domain-containing protein n=1 Tax=Bombilactobacillus folatiphilus TaxID=2923362 RepID=A0ABY4P814_9LACO|nr:DUF4176 domain-containing protein [Bombilactobacillus folatiphilus]UQS81669.1 DUF4176 domain-containing protein [Bombilactobacillus folatiphilus]
MHILPIGSVVTLKEDQQTPLMIVNRAALFEEKKGKVGYFDYSAVLYPNGLDENEEMCFFNQSDIEQILFEGYQNDEEQNFAAQYEQLVSQSGYPQLTSHLF